MIINASNLRNLTSGYSAAFNKTLGETKTHYQELATTVQSGTAENNYPWLGQMGGLREWIGDREVQNLSEYGYTIRNRTFEKTIGVPREAIEDDQYGVYTPMFSMIGQEAAQHPDELVFELLTGGFKEKCYDGKAFFAKDHPSGDAEFSNASDLELTRESFLAARAAVMSFCGDKGKALNIVPDLLVVSPKNEARAKEIVEADIINGTTNITKGMARLMVATQLAGDTEEMWFLFSTHQFLKPLIYQRRKALKMTMLTKEDDLNVFMKKEYLYGCDCRDNVGFGFWQMAFGSTGKTAAQG